MRRAPRLRYVLVGLALLAALQLALAITAFLRINTNAEGAFRFPLPSRVVAIVATIESAPVESRPQLLEALDGPDFTVAIAPAQSFEPNAEGMALPRVEDLVKRYVAELGERDVIAWIAPEESQRFRTPRFESFRLYSPVPLRIAVALDTGEWVVIETRDPIAREIYGLPPGLWAGLFGVVVALTSLYALWRGLWPLEALAQRVSDFARTQNPQATPPRGPRETREVIEAVNAMQQSIADLLRERAAMFAGISHDLRTYLTRLQLRIEKLDGTDRAKAEAELDAMGAIIEDGLVYARMGAVEPAREPIEAPAFLARVAEHGGARLGEIAVHRFSADPSLLRRALTNLCRNAALHGGGGTLSARREPNASIFEVADRGPGIAAGDRERLMAAFERGDSARTHDKPGSGLGLAIAMRVAQLHGGRLELRDREGGGLIARVILPGEGA